MEKIRLCTTITDHCWWEWISSLKFDLHSCDGWWGWKIRSNWSKLTDKCNIAQRTRTDQHSENGKFWISCDCWARKLNNWIQVNNKLMQFYMLVEFYAIPSIVILYFSTPVSCSVINEALWLQCNFETWNRQWMSLHWYCGIIVNCIWFLQCSSRKLHNLIAIR